LKYNSGVLPPTCLLTCALLFALSSVAQTCNQVVFGGELHAGESFHQEFGGTLLFQIEPVDETGWAFDISQTTTSPKSSPGGFIYPLTPPYRGRNAQQINTGWGTLAQDAAHVGSVDFQFLLNSPDLDRAYELLDSVLWPGKEDFQTALEKLSALPHGWGTFTITTSNVVPGTPVPGYSDCARGNCGKIERIRFSVELTVPGSFRFGPNVKSSSVPCPLSTPKSKSHVRKRGSCIPSGLN
jgi:hypothetical protein